MPVFNTKMYGFYSAKQVEHTKETIVYTTPAGLEVTVSFISEDPSGSGCLWDDLVSCGEIVDFVRFAHGSGTRRVY
jgi:hypothetical protein